MKLTPEKKKYIDETDYEELLRRWRYAPTGDPWFEGETGEYWGQRMTELRTQDGGQGRHVAASKAVGWDG